MHWSGIPIILQISFEIRLGVLFACMPDVTHHIVYSAIFCILPRAVKILSQILMQNTSEDTVLCKDVPFRGHKTIINI